MQDSHDTAVSERWLKSRIERVEMKSPHLAFKQLIMRSGMLVIGGQVLIDREASRINVIGTGFAGVYCSGTREALKSFGKAQIGQKSAGRLPPNLRNYRWCFEDGHAKHF